MLIYDIKVIEHIFSMFSSRRFTALGFTVTLSVLNNDDDDFIIVTVWPCEIFGPFPPFIFIFYPGGKEVIQHKDYKLL